MSSSTPRYHIPFPTAFLSLNTPTKRSASVSATTPVAEFNTHTFLSNRPVVPHRHSVSSVSSVDSTASTALSPSAKTADSPVLKSAVPAFLTLNSKHAAPPATAKGMMDDNKSPFLSNRH